MNRLLVIGRITGPGAPPPLRAARGRPLLVEVGRRVAEHVSPYPPGPVSPSGAVADRFYRWDAPAVAAR